MSNRLKMYAERVLSSGYSRKGLEGSALMARETAVRSTPIKRAKGNENRWRIEGGFACCQASSNIASNEKTEEREREREGGGTLGKHL